MPYSSVEQPTSQLLEDWAAIMRELRRRDVVRTNNNPAGDIAEAIVQAHYPGSTRGSFSQKGWDVLTADGERIQVKAMRTTATTNRTNLSPIRDTEYDSVIVVIFDESFRVTEGLRFPRAVVEELFEHKPYVNGRVVRITGPLLAHPDVEGVDLTDAAARLPTG